MLLWYNFFRSQYDEGKEMAESLVAALGGREPQKLDPNEFKPKSGGKLDTVSEGNIKGLIEDNEKALIKVANYEPIRLKNLASDMQSTITKGKQKTAVRQAISAIVKEKVQSVREENPFSNPIEKQAGKHLNTTA